jgi:hypothetical protein
MKNLKFFLAVLLSIFSAVAVAGPQNCEANYVADFSEEGSAERLAVIAVPAFCDGWSYRGSLYELKSDRGAGELRFFVYKVEAGQYAGDIAFPEEGGTVRVADYRPLVVSVNGITVNAYSGGALLSGKVAGIAYGSVSRKNCTSGCGQTQISSGSGYLIIDASWDVGPGSPVFNDNDQMVGLVIGVSQGRTLVLGMERIFQLMSEAGLTGGKG